jgi:hypothetical protein
MGKGGVELVEVREVVAARECKRKRLFEGRGHAASSHRAGFGYLMGGA